VAVLEALGYMDHWALTPAGERLGRIYHESDLLVAEALDTDLLEGAEPAVVAGVLSAVIFEPRRARRIGGSGPSSGRGQGRGGQGRGRPGGPPRTDAPKRAPLQDRLGEKRSGDLRRRCDVLVEMGERIRMIEEDHGVPRTRQPSPGLATAITSWARGASFGTALGVAARDVGELAPGDFVRTVKSVADLVGQVTYAAVDPSIAQAAREAVDMLLRGVVAGGLPST
jgi:ATP-dependent RNA helicase HelY